MGEMKGEINDPPPPQDPPNSDALHCICSASELSRGTVRPGASELGGTLRGGR